MVWRNQINFIEVRRSITTHYDILGVERNCSTSDIKDAYIKLSKELHPDMNPDSPHLHKKFLAVNEAYSVLSKDHLRLSYDAELAYRDSQPHFEIRTNAPRERVFYRDESIWEMRDRSQDYKYDTSRPYYGTKLIKKKLPNSYIAAGAVIFMIIGAIFHAAITKMSSDRTIEQLNRASQLASANHDTAREAARAHGNQMQMRLMANKLGGMTDEERAEMLTRRRRRSP